MSEKFEKDIQKSIKLNHKVSDETKEMVWNRIERDINRSDLVKKSRNTRIFNSIVASAAAALIVFGTFETKPGQAMIKNIKDMFDQEKKVEISVEGEKEKTKTKLLDGTQKENGKSDYVLYYDKERYTMKKEDDKDILTPKIKAENAPEVSLTISQKTGMTEEKVVNEIQDELKKKYQNVTAENVNDPFKATMIRVVSGNEWNSVVKNVYILDNHKGGVFVIEEHLFLEASEGHGARFYQMQVVS